MSTIELFRYSNAETVRVVMIDNGPWFVSADVLAMLDLGRSSVAILDEDEKGVHAMDTPGGVQQVSVISESGLYSLILRSRKSEARAIKRWITGTVLPEIRRTGSYNAPTAIPQTREERLALALLDAHQVLEEKNKELEQVIDYFSPMVAKAEAHSGSDSAISRQQFAREVQTWGKTRNIRINQDQVYWLMNKLKLFVKGGRRDSWEATAHAIKSGYALTEKGVTAWGYQYSVGILTAKGQDHMWAKIIDYIQEHGDLKPRPIS